MKSKQLILLKTIISSLVLIITQTYAQTPVQVGAGSYASFPPSEELEFEWEGVTYYNDYNFVYNDPIYVADGETRPIPTNDWWTRILIDQYGGLLFAYPLVMEPTAEGLKVQYPIGFNASGSDLDRGAGLLVKAGGYSPDKAIAKDWTDWSVVMGMPDESTGANMDVTMAHGIPFTYIESQGINPVITASAGASYYNAAGNAVDFPIQAGGEFVLQSEGRLFGIHLGNGVTAEITGQQHLTIDLGATYSLNSVNIIWEAAFASGYSIQVSNDNANWTTLQTVVNGDGGTDNIGISGSGRYLRILLTERGTIFAYSIFELEVYSGATNVALNKTAFASSEETGFTPYLAVDGNTGTRWASLAGQEEQLVINMNGGANHFVISALKQYSDLAEYENYAHNKPIETIVNYSYDVDGGKVNTTWNITTDNLNGEADGNTVQGFIPHQYKNTSSSSVNFTSRDYVSARGALKTAIGKSFSFSYNFGGILPSFTSPYKNTADGNAYEASTLYALLTKFASAKTGYGADTYWGGKDLVNIAKYALMAKELNHQSYEKLKDLAKASLIDWLTYTAGETEHYFARYDRWKALIGFDQSYGSAQFTDNHFHYGYLIHAAGLYGMLDSDFLADYGPMLELVCKQYANWDRNDNFLPYFRTFDPWIGHSYAGGTSSGGGNNQESTSEAMQSWIGMFLLGEMMGNDQMRDAGAFGYRSEAAATLEYWFDWDQENLPVEYPHDVVGILWNGGFAYGTYFSASPVHIHGIQYLPVCPGFKYLAENKTWAAKEYADMMTESAAIDGHANEIDFGDDWAQVALGFRLLYDPEYVSQFMTANLALGEGNDDYIMDYEVSGMTYFYTHAVQNLGDFSFNYYTNFPASSVFEENGNFSHAVVFNSENTEQTCYVKNNAGAVIATFQVPAKTLVTYPELPEYGQKPDGCYNLTAEVSATSGNGSAPAAVDASMGTRWTADSNAPCVFDLDLGVKCTINELSIAWEVANASDYNVLGSNDGVTYSLIESFTGLAMGDRTEILNNITEAYRYLRLDILAPSTDWAYSIYEIGICGEVAGGDDPVTGIILPGKVEAEAYTAMQGIQTEACSEGTDNVGWTDAGDWMEYNVHVQTAGTYTINARVASPAGGSSLELLMNNASKGTFAIGATGSWQTWQTVSISAYLDAGNQTLKLSCLTGGFNVNYVDFSTGSTPVSIHIEAEDYITMQGIATEACSEGTLNVGWIDATDYMDYSVNIPSSGNYVIDYRLASAPGGGSLQVQSNGNTLATTAIEATGGWQVWTTKSETISLSAGQQTIRLYAASGGFNVNWIELTDANSKSGKLSANENEQLVVSIYPNPFNETIKINSESNIKNINIYSIEGKLVFSKANSLPTNTLNANLSELPNGIYFLKAECETTTITNKIIKK